MIDFERLLRALVDGGVEFVVVGGVAAALHGSVRLTTDLDVVYSRSRDNMKRVAAALAPLDPYLRGAPAGLPFRFDADTIQRGLNFTLTTTAGPIDFLGEMSGVGNYEAVAPRSDEVTLFGLPCRCIRLDALIEAKRAAGRPKDLEVIAELETIRRAER
jgi:predicted nucleotidyltransferase